MAATSARSSSGSVPARRPDVAAAQAEGGEGLLDDGDVVGGAVGGAQLLEAADLLPDLHGGRVVAGSKRFDHVQRDGRGDVHQPRGEAGGAGREVGGRVRLGEPGDPDEALQAGVPGEGGEARGVRHGVLHADDVRAGVGEFGEPGAGELRRCGCRARRPARARPPRSPGGSRPSRPARRTGGPADGPSPSAAPSSRACSGGGDGGRHVVPDADQDRRPGRRPRRSVNSVTRRRSSGVRA